jgi:nucleotide-binding universal stress UspA family protein
VLCPTDFSDASAHAVEWAVVMAGHYRARLTALHVASPILMGVPGPAPAMPVEPMGEGELEQLRKTVTAEFVAASADQGRLNVLVDVGHPIARILERAERLPADLIVMGTHGASGFEHLVLGSVTEKVLRKARCPVLTVPPRAQATSRLPFKRVLCAIDFSDPSLGALDSAVSLARESNATLTLVHVLQWPWEEPPAPVLEELPHDQGVALAEFRRYTEQTALKRMQELVASSCDLPNRARVRLESGRAYAQILKVAEEEGTDLMVIGVHGRGAVDVALFGSTANQVVRRATCPVLTLRL